METFIFAANASEVGGYLFDVDMTDSLCTYDFDFYTRLDSRRSELGAFQDYPLSVTWIDPDGERYSQTVFMDVTAATNQTYFSRQLVFPFMEGVVPIKYGQWHLKVSVPDAVADMGMRGFGLIARRNVL